ncbi:hypothetical protein PIB30_056476 [Stylosanthes scabra]|uniref:Uncharacterized protein n=1 Tax=Stylosanthes scabra TaxID=79078 RepID=A0ABU6ZI65_9FABA|nr:hypothetical protein [Stylosanthes scabra]
MFHQTGEDYWTSSLDTDSSLYDDDDNDIESENSDDSAENLEKDMPKNKRKERGISGTSNNTCKRVKKVDREQKLSQQIDRLCEAVERRNSDIINIRGPSITTAIEHLDALPNLDPMSELYMFATRLFLNRDKRETFIALKQSKVKLAWLKSEKNERNKA